MNALIDDDLSNPQLKEADEGPELPRSVMYSRLGVVRDERRKSMVGRKQPRAGPHRHRQLDRGLPQPQAAAHCDRLSQADSTRTAAHGCMNPRAAVEPLLSRFLQSGRGLEAIWHIHPMGEANETRKTVLARASEDAMVVDTMAVRVHVRWDETTPPPVRSATE